jgi:hypothetical protein
MFYRWMLFIFFLSACSDRGTTHLKQASEADSVMYNWIKLADTTGFSPSSHVQFMNIRDTVWAVHPNGIYFSIDGISFQPSSLTTEMTRSSFSDVIFFNNKLIAFGKHLTTLGKSTSSIITFESTDLRHWTATPSNLPISDRYRPVVFNGRLWIFTGNESTKRNLQAWNSSDGIRWNKIADSLAFPAGEHQLMFVFRKKLIALSTGCMQSEDGIHWRNLDCKSAPAIEGRTPIIFNDKIWLFGSVPSAKETPGVVYSADGKTWDSMTSPWIKRSNPAACVFRAAILLSSGDHRKVSGTSHLDSLLNDVWQFADSKTLKRNNK